MKNFTDENINRVSAFNDFLDTLDNDTTSSIATLEPATNNENVDISNNVSVHNSTENTTDECTALTVTKPNSLFVAQKMFRKSIKLSIKSFLISLSLGFLNLFI